MLVDICGSLTHVGIDQYNGKERKHYKLRAGNRGTRPVIEYKLDFFFR